MNNINTAFASQNNTFQLQRSLQTSNSTNNLSQAFGKTFLEQVAQVVSSNEASNRQKMQDKKAEYSSKKKIKDLEDERVALLGRVRVLGQKFS